MHTLKIAKLHFLLGKWKGSGSGKFPTITSFDYDEILTFRTDSYNDLIHYEQRTWLKRDDTPSHWESGFIKPVDGEDNVFEITNAQDSGRVEVLRGEFYKDKDDYMLHFKMVTIANDPRMMNSERIFTIKDDKLSYIVKMATKNTPEHQHHLQSLLEKE
jgi:THAP domain-containing protein 4